MKKNLLNELSEMKYMFGYKRGVVISEQDVAEPEIDIDIDTTTKPDIDRRPNPFNPDRAREFNPFPDLEPQGEEDEEIYMSEPDVMEPEIDIDTTTRPDIDRRPNPFNPDKIAVIFTHVVPISVDSFGFFSMSGFPVLS